MNNMNDAIVTVTDPHSAQEYPYEDKKQHIHISATEIHDPLEPKKRPRIFRRQTTNTYGDQNEPEHQLTAFGKYWNDLLRDSALIRYCIYILPVATVLAIPLILYGAVEPYNHRKLHGIRLVGLMVWLEIIWASFWLAKLVAGAIPLVFQIISGLFSTGVRKYSLVLSACELPLSLFIWSIAVYCCQPIIWGWSKHTHAVSLHTVQTRSTVEVEVSGTTSSTPVYGIHWLKVVNKVCIATIAVCALYLAEKLLVQMIAVSYHKRQFHDKIRNIKRITLAIDHLYDASLRRYPDRHINFDDLDNDIHDTNGVQKLGSKAKLNNKTMHLIRDMGWMTDKLTTAFGTLVSDMTGKNIKPTGNHAVVEQALERHYGAEALARRIFKALDKENDDAITEQDLIDELGPGNEEDARFIFGVLDQDRNGDVSLEEMLNLVGNVARERKLMWQSANDVKEALKILDRAMEGVVLILVLFIYAALYSNYLATHYSQIWTSFTGLSFMLGPTASELLSACILVFVKHPYDIGDRVDMSGYELVVTRISLLYTAFRRIDNDRSIQVPNSVINSLFVENATRSSNMKERLTFSVSAGTSFDDIETLRRELQDFVELPENRRDYYPDVDVELMGVADLKQLDLRVEIKHKSNWSDEKLRAYRRSKFMCALLSAMRKVPIAGPGGDGAPNGSPAAPNYTVTITDDIAQAAKAKFDADKDAKRLFPKNVENGIGQAVSSGLDLLPSLISRKASTTGGNPFEGNIIP